MSGWFRSRLTESSPWLLLLAGLQGYLAWTAMRLILLDTPLEYDESVYAVGGRGLLQGGPETGFPPYRPVGMKLVAAIGVALGGSEIALRVVSLALALACMVALWWLAVHAASARVATWSVAIVVTSHELQRRASELLSDLPSLLFILLALAVMVRELRRPGGLTWKFMLVAPLAAAAFYLRYGSLLTLAVIAVAALIVWWRSLWSRRGVVLATAAALIALMIPHCVHSLARTGKILGMLSRGATAAGRTYVGDGLVFYARGLVDKLGGIIIGVALIIGMIHGIAALIRIARGRGGVDDRSSAFLFLVALLHTLGVGLLAHGEARFVFLGTFLLVVLAVKALVSALPKTRSVVLWLPLLLVLLIYSEARWQWTRAGMILSGQARSVPAEAGRLIRQDAGSGDCAVLTSSVPQITWYSGCVTHRLPLTSPAAAERVLSRLDQPHRYLVVFDKGRRQPSAQVLEAMSRHMGDAPLGRIEDPSGRGNHATIYRFLSRRTPRPDSWR